MRDPPHLLSTAHGTARCVWSHAVSDSPAVGRECRIAALSNYGIFLVGPLDHAVCTQAIMARRARAYGLCNLASLVGPSCPSAATAVLAGHHPCPHLS